MFTFKIRKGNREDCVEVRKLIQELADFEKMPDSVEINSETLQEDGFGSDHPPFHCIVAEHPEDPNRLIGYAIYSIGYHTWDGKILYLEDIYVTEKYRRAGVGSLIFSKVCQESLQENCKKMHFAVLDWNPAAEFYLRLGAKDVTSKEGWHFFGLYESGIKEIAK